MASGEIEAVKSRGQSMAKLVVRDGTDVRRKGRWGAPWSKKAKGGPCTRKLGCPEYGSSVSPRM